MHPNKLLRFANMFYSLAAGEELPPNSDDLKVVLSNLEQLETYAARKKYAESNLKHLSSGSSRIVYLTPRKTIVKLAKNDKGIAQNKADPVCRVERLDRRVLDEVGIKKLHETINSGFGRSLALSCLHEFSKDMRH